MAVGRAECSPQPSLHRAAVRQPNATTAAAAATCAELWPAHEHAAVLAFVLLVQELPTPVPRHATKLRLSFRKIFKPHLPPPTIILEQNPKFHAPKGAPGAAVPSPVVSAGAEQPRLASKEVEAGDGPPMSSRDNRLQPLRLQVPHSHGPRRPSGHQQRLPCACTHGAGVNRISWPTSSPGACMSAKNRSWMI